MASSSSEIASSKPTPPPFDTVRMSTYFTPLFLFLLSVCCRRVWSRIRPRSRARRRCFYQSESIEWVIEDQAFLRSYYLGHTPLPSSSCLSFSVFLWVAGRVFWRERSWWGEWGGAKQYKKVWSPINHLILSAFNPTLHSPPPPPTKLNWHRTRLTMPLF